MSFNAMVKRPQHNGAIIAQSTSLGVVAAIAVTTQAGGAFRLRGQRCLPVMMQRDEKRDRTKVLEQCGAQHPDIKSNLTSTSGDDDAADCKTRKIQSFGDVQMSKI